MFIYVLYCWFNNYSANRQQYLREQQYLRDQNNQRMTAQKLADANNEIYHLYCDARIYAKKITELKKAIKVGNSKIARLERNNARQKTEFPNIYVRDVHKIEALKQAGANDECSVCFESVCLFVTNVSPIN